MICTALQIVVIKYFGEILLFINHMDIIYKRQISDNPLSLNDINRIFLKIDGDIFDSIDCIIWSGCVSSLKQKIKRFPVIFLDGRKQCVKRLIYNHFIQPIDKNQYISMKCSNSLCINTKHMICKKYKIKIKIKVKREDDTEYDPDKFVIRFD
jgi:hypothetical protein